MPNRRLAPIALVMLPLLLNGCGGKSEDVRVTLCRNLAVTLLDSPQRSDWWYQDTRITRLSHAEVLLRFNAEERNGRRADYRAVCHFPYTGAEENVITHTDPITAYATLPHKMTLNGREIPKRMIDAAVNAVVKQQGLALLQKVRTEFRQVMGLGEGPR